MKCILLFAIEVLNEFVDVECILPDSLMAKFTLAMIMALC